MAKAPRPLRGKVIVVTGGAQGIGAKTAEALVAHGAKVVVADLDQVRAEKTAGELGGDTLALPLDVTDSARFTELLDEVERRLGPLDVLINNAGIMPIGSFEDETERTSRAQIAINLTAVIHGTREAVKRMRPRGTGHIVNVASYAGKVGFPGGAVYCATKHGVVGLSEAVRAELHKTGVEVSCVMPAIVRTELASGLVESNLVRTVRPEEVAEAIVAALQRPRFDIVLPRYLDYIGRVSRLLPRRAAEALMRAMKADKILAGAHAEQRAEYEARAAESGRNVTE